jgi:uracil-DNA glycosylase
MDVSQIKLEPSWIQRLGDEFAQDYMTSLRQFLAAEFAAGKTIYPKGAEFFTALNLTPFEKVKVVIIGQDPYHGPGQAHGLSFSVKPGISAPPSLVNIFKELKNDLGLAPPSHGYLKSWAEQGVLLLNAVLTVEMNRAASHQGRGWERFTDRIVKELNDKREHLVFMLWGSYAQKKCDFVDTRKHLVLRAPHPSPLSAHRGFLGCGHFSMANRYLEQHGLATIDWQLPTVARSEFPQGRELEL